MPKNILDNIQFPSDLRKLDINELTQVCKDLREFIIDVISENPGHFGASLGVVELTVALHYALNTPYDRLVWDVGHQAYGHKILTGRKDIFHTNRKFGGLSGFPKPSESEYDTFGVGHSSTSVSAALGMAMAAAQKGETDRQIVAVIGDGSLTGGMAFEALNHAGSTNANLLVVVNDNNMAIDANVGALNQYLVDITTSKGYNRLKDDVWKFLGMMSKFGPNTLDLAKKIENGIKSIILKESNLFESLNFRYFGPVDGHDVVQLVKLLEDLKSMPGPKVLHCKTQKGKGFKLAEIDQTKWHAPGKFNKETGEILKKESNVPLPPRFQDVFGETVLELAEKDNTIVGITPAMASGSSLNLMMEKMPHRAFDVGIAEQHAVTLAAGLAKDGMTPFCNIYSTFIQRAYDQVIHDVAIQKLPVIFCLDRGGLVGADGATHHGVFDITYMRAIPNLVVAAPLDEIDLRNILYTASIQKEQPFAIRYPRGRGRNVNWKVPFEKMPIGKGRMLRDGDSVAVLTLGHIGEEVQDLYDRFNKEGISAAHYDMRFAKPLDTELLHEIFKKFSRIITVEEGQEIGGFGTAILEFMADNGYSAKIKRLGIPDRFIEHGEIPELRKQIGIDAQSIFSAIKEIILEKIKTEL